MKAAQREEDDAFQSRVVLASGLWGRLGPPAFTHIWKWTLISQDRVSCELKQSEFPVLWEGRELTQA